MLMEALREYSGKRIYDHYPSVHNSVIQVGATTNLNTLASYSNWGQWQELVAPGGGKY